jgi:spore maturation protein CgeB
MSQGSDGSGSPGSTPLRVMLYGQFTWDYLASSYLRAFEAAGASVIPFDESERAAHFSPWLRTRVGHRLSVGSLALRSLGARAWNQRLLSRVREAKPDLLLVLKGDFVMRETIEAIRDLGVVVFIFHTDNPFPGHASSRPETIAAARACDCYFIWARSLVSALRDAGAPRVEYLPFGWDPFVLPHAPYKGDAEWDAGFVGGWDREREEWLAPVAARVDLRVWGPPYWTRTRPGSPLRAAWQGTALHGAAAAEVLRRTPISLNIVRRQNLPDGVIMRTFELPGCGAFALSRRTSGAMEIFPEGEAGAYFDTPEELLEQLDRYSVDVAARQRMARAAHLIVSQAHTYEHRARQIIDTYWQFR